MPAIWGVIALVIVSICGFALVGTKLEKFVEDTAAALTDDLSNLSKNVLNPGVVIAVVVVVFIVFGGLKGGSG